MTSDREIDLPETNVADSYVIDMLHAFDEVIELHRMFDKAGANPPDYYPDEIEHLVDTAAIENAWRFRNYDVIRKAYAEGWIQYAKDVIHEEALLSADELCEMSRSH